MMMAELFKVSGYKFAVAHCNFGLRSKESDRDEAFVKAWAAKHKTTFYSIRFDTKKYAAKKKISIQMAARELRYHWLNELKEKHKLDFIAIAHNSDDVIETFFINLIRGTGIAGLHGIAASNGHIIRPMLTFSRNDIKKYAEEINLKWREDSSNAADKYERNKIRHHLIPLLEDINPQSRKAINHTIKNLREVEHIYHSAIENDMKEATLEKKGKFYLSIPRLKKTAIPSLFIYEVIKQHGFNYPQAEEIANSLEKQAGKQFFSSTHRLTKDREQLIIEVIQAKKAVNIYQVGKDSRILSVGPFDIDFSTDDIPKGFKPPKSPATACLDYSLLKFPLTIRKWQKGDRFYPLGMNKPKKVSDFLIDKKVPVSEKDATYILLSGQDIVWIIGHRIDERFKISLTTKKMYLCNIEYITSL